ncbi:MAG TPA: xanthine dehydrogenase family protein molybdopterin-binding subunit, partial [Nitrobacter sp.]|nr:xanthine dehydrogenase family protein molybdopterin-binding subunit [Nitrobacter sp.]
MTSYIGTATSRVDGRDKVTGAARYAGEHGAPDLAHGSVVTSTIAKGRIRRIDTGEAMKIDGVIAILTHENRPPMANNDKAYKDDVAPEQGSPYRPLYDGEIKFNGQPVALVLAEDFETATFAASLVRVEYDEQPHITDIERQRSNAIPLDAPAKPRGDAAQAFAASDIRHDAEYYVPVEHHNPMELFASTAVWR